MTMKKPTLIILSLASLFYISCNNKTGDKTQTTDTTEVESTSGESSTSEETETTQNENPVEKPYVMASIRKTPCYGKCPVFEAKFYSDGRAEYKGKMNVDKIGNYTSRVDKETLRSIKSKAMEVGYLDFEREYPTGEVKISDLPTTVTHLRIGDMTKTISNKYQAPEGLKTYEKFLTDMIDRMEWTKSPSEDNK